MVKLLRLQGKEKNRKPAKRMRVSTVQSKDKDQDQATESFAIIQGDDSTLKPIEVSLFFTETVIQDLTEGDTVHTAKVRFSLIDGGSQGNLIPQHVIKALKAKMNPAKTICEVASGEQVQFDNMAWLMVTVVRFTRVIPATVVEGNLGFTILLGCHWMHSMKVKGNYTMGTYHIPNEKGALINIPRSVNLQNPGRGGSDFKLTRVAVKPKEQKTSLNTSLNFVNSKELLDLDSLIISILKETGEEREEYEADSESISEN